MIQKLANETTRSDMATHFTGQYYSSHVNWHVQHEDHTCCSGYLFSPLLSGRLGSMLDHQNCLTQLSLTNPLSTPSQRSQYMLWIAMTLQAANMESVSTASSSASSYSQPCAQQVLWLEVERGPYHDLP